MILSEIFYKIVGWLNFPDRTTPLGQNNLRHMDNGILQCAQYILTLSQDKAEKSEVNTMVQNVTLDTDTGILTVSLKNGTVTSYDLAIEKVVVNFSINDDNELVLELADGEQIVIDLTRFVYSVASTATIAMQISNRTITADVVDGSITLDKLEQSVMSTLRQYMIDAQTAASSSERYYTASKSWAVGGTASRDNEDEDNSKYYSQIAKQEADRAESYSELTFPEFDLNEETGHLICTQGKNVTVSVNKNNHVIVEVA